MACELTPATTAETRPPVLKLGSQKQHGISSVLLNRPSHLQNRHENLMNCKIIWNGPTSSKEAREEYFTAKSPPELSPK
jgi:hypothetical protein